MTFTTARVNDPRDAFMDGEKVEVIHSTYFDLAKLPNLQDQFPGQDGFFVYTVRDRRGWETAYREDKLVSA